MQGHRMDGISSYSNLRDVCARHRRPWLLGCITLMCLVSLGCLSGCAETVEAVPANEADAAPDEKTVSTPSPVGEAPAPESQVEAATATVTEEATTSEVAATYREIGPLRIEPGELDFGQVQAGVKLQGQVQLTNISNEPVRIVKTKTSCGCTVASVPKKAFGPGESVSVEVKFSPGAKPGSKRTKTISFVLADHEQPVQVRVSAEVAEFVRPTPRRLPAPSDTDQTITLESVTGEPFKVLSVDPAGLVKWSKDQSTVTHTLTISAEAWVELNRPRRLTLELDHPRLTSLAISIDRPRSSRVDSDRGADVQTPTSTVTRAGGATLRIVPRRLQLGRLALGESTIRQVLLRDIKLAPNTLPIVTPDSPLVTAEALRTEVVDQGVLVWIRLSPAANNATQQRISGSLQIQIGGRRGVAELDVTIG